MRSKDGKWSRPELRSTLCALVFSVCSTACGATNQETSGVDTPGEIDSQCSPSNTCEDGGDTGCEVTTKCEPADCGNKPNNCGGTIYCGVCTGDESCDWVAGDTGPAYDIDTYDVKSTTVDGHKVEYLLIPVDALGEGTPWSNWGEGEVHSNGRYYGSFGNHLKGQHLPNAGNAWLYEYDPATQKIRILADALFANQDYTRGSYGYGKVHGQVDEGPCGILYFSTYRGAQDAPQFVGEGSYNGDLIIRYNPVTENVVSLGEVTPGQMSPSTNLWRAGGLLYGEGPTGETRANPEALYPDDYVRFWAYDVNTQKLVWSGESHVRANRNIAIDAMGRAYFNSPSNNGLMRYTPPSESNPTGSVSEKQVVTFPPEENGWLRASTRPRSDGTMVFVTRGNTAYLFDPADDKLSKIADTDGYTASIVLSTDEKSFYSVGGHAHFTDRFDLQKTEIATGKRTTLARLYGAVEERGQSPTGTFDIRLSADGKTIYMTANAGENGNAGFPMFIAIHL